MRRRNKDMEAFLKGTFTGGGIFDEPAKVEFKPRPQQQSAGPSLEDLIRRQAAGKRAEANKAIQGDAKKVSRIKKLEALANDPAASAGERETALRMIEKLRG